MKRKHVLGAYLTRETVDLLAMMALFFLVVTAIGILRPIKNSLALDGLGATDFYKVYLVSAIVIVFVPAYNRLADRFAWGWLIPAVALFFATHLVLFRLLYQSGSSTLGLVFYGWYDLFAAALVTQFFMLTQLYFNARSAKQAYPLVIAGGSIGAVLGSAITGFFAVSLGTPNLLLVAAGFITIFAVGLFVIGRRAHVPVAARRTAAGARFDTSEFRALLNNPQVRMIAVMVLLIVVIKQLVDYQFNTLTKEVFETRDAISAFQGKFNAATQWLPLVVLAALRPLLRRWGIALAVLIMPLALLMTNGMLFIFFGLAAAVAVKAADTSLRYSAERTAREILYVPVPDEIKLKAKAYIDVAIEKGVGKVVSAGLIFVLLLFLEPRWIVFVSVLLCVALAVLAIAVRREYVRALAGALEGRFASLSGGFASITDATTLPLVRRSLVGGSPVQTAFALELIGQAAAGDIRRIAAELNELLAHPQANIRVGALDVLRRAPDAALPERVEQCLHDPVPEVREAAVRLFCARGAAEAMPATDDTAVTAAANTELIDRLLASPHAEVRTATLACLLRGDLPAAGRARIGRAFLDRSRVVPAGAAESRLEIALAAGMLDLSTEARELLEPFLDDEDPRVTSTALRSAGLLGEPAFHPRLVLGLGPLGTREAARDALERQGAAVLPILTQWLMNRAAPPAVRRQIPSVLGRIPAQQSVEALFALVIAPETDELLDYRSIKALSKLRAHHAHLHFPRQQVITVAEREVAEAEKYAAAHAALLAEPALDRGAALLAQAVEEAWHERRENTFRLLGLVLPPDRTYAAYGAVCGVDGARRAKALEWLENMLGRVLYVRLAAVLEQRIGTSPTRASLLDASAGLHDNGDEWVALCARAVSRGLAGGGPPPNGVTGEPMSEVIERVFLLQEVDLLRGARSAHLALLASIAEEIDAAEGTVILQRGELPDALYVVSRGEVEVDGLGGAERVGVGSAIGSWALIDEEPSMVDARVVERARLLRITRADFQDLLADHPELAVGVLRGLARRVRALVG